MFYNIHNPTLARRIIYDGSPAQRKIEVAPGETKYNVAVEPHIAAGFSDGTSGDKSNLWLIPVGQPSPPPSAPEPSSTFYVAQDQAEVVKPPKVPQLPESYKRYQAPLVDPIEESIKFEAEEDKRKKPKRKTRAKKHACQARYSSPRSQHYAWSDAQVASRCPAASLSEMPSSRCL